MPSQAENCATEKFIKGYFIYFKNYECHLKLKKKGDKKWEDIWLEAIGGFNRFGAGCKQRGDVWV